MANEKAELRKLVSRLAANITTANDIYEKQLEKNRQYASRRGAYKQLIQNILARPVSGGFKLDPVQYTISQLIPGINVGIFADAAGKLAESVKAAIDNGLYVDAAGHVLKTLGNIGFGVASVSPFANFAKTIYKRVSKPSNTPVEFNVNRMPYSAKEIEEYYNSGTMPDFDGYDPPVIIEGSPAYRKGIDWNTGKPINIDNSTTILKVYPAKGKYVTLKEGVPRYTEVDPESGGIFTRSYEHPVDGVDLLSGKDMESLFSRYNSNTARLSSDGKTISFFPLDAGDFTFVSPDGSFYAPGGGTWGEYFSHPNILASPNGTILYKGTSPVTRPVGSYGSVVLKSGGKLNYLNYLK